MTLTGLASAGENLMLHRPVVLRALRGTEGSSDLFTVLLR